MQVLDTMIVIIVVYHAISGFRRGLIRILIEVAGIGIGMFNGMQHYSELMKWFQQFSFLPTKILPALSFVSIWIAVFLAFSFVGYLVGFLFDKTLFSPLNRLGGLLLGFSQGVIFLIPLLMLLVYFDVKAVDHSMFTRPAKPYLKEGIHRLLKSPDLTGVTLSSIQQ